MTAGPQSTVSSIDSIYQNSNGGNLSVATGSSFVYQGHNLFSDSPGVTLAPTDLVNTDPLLGPLADNGGPTFTQTLLTGSLAIDGGIAVAGVTTDQRGDPRPTSGPTDIGAVQVSRHLQLDGPQEQAIFGGPKGRSSPAPGGTRGTGARPRSRRPEGPQETLRHPFRVRAGAGAAVRRFTPGWVPATLRDAGGRPLGPGWGSSRLAPRACATQPIGALADHGGLRTGVSHTTGQAARLKCR